jgi:uncharacterized protein YodC (DUF2158 family)
MAGAGFASSSRSSRSPGNRHTITVCCEEMTPFKIGDVVTLQGGGPKMTVENIDTKITCVWVTDAGNLFRESFIAGVLKKTGPDAGRGRGRSRGRERVEEVRG